MALGILKVHLVAEIWDFIKKFRVAKGTILAFSKISSAAIQLIHTSLGKLGLVAAGTFAILAGGALLLRKQLAPAVELQRDMASIATLMRDKVGQAVSATDKWVKIFTKSIINLSAEFGDSASDTAKGLYDILSATIPASDALNVLIVSMRAARAGLATTALATKAIISVLMSYNMAFDQAAKISDIFFATIRRGVTTFKELTPVIGRAAATAAAAGVSFEELMAAVSTMTRAGLDTGVAITSINQTLLQFFRPTEEAVKASAKLGFNLDLTTLQTEGLVAVMEKLSDILPQQVGQMFRQMRALRGVNALIQQVSGYTEDFNIMLTATGETQAAFNKQAKALGFSLDRLRQNFKALRIQAALPWMGTAKKLVESLNSLFGALRKVVPAISQVSGDLIIMGGTAAGVTAAVALTAAILKTLGVAAGALLLVMGKFALIATVVYVLVRALIALQKRFQLVTKALDFFIKHFLPGMLTLEKVKKAIYGLGNALKWLGKHFGLVREEWSEMATAKALASSLKALTEEVDKSVKPTDELLDRWKSVIEALRRGAPMTAEVKKGLAALAATLKITPVYSEATKKGLLELVDAVSQVGKITEGTRGRIAAITEELSKGKAKNDLYVQMWVQLLDKISAGEILTDEYRKVLASMYSEMDKTSNISAKLKQRISELVNELLNTANVTDIVRKKMREIQDAFNKNRATMALLNAAFEILGVDMPQHLSDIAKEADWAFGTIRREGGYSAEILSKVWMEGFIPKLMNAFGKIPERYRDLTLKMTGYTLEMIQALSILDIDRPSQLQKEARKAAGALLTLTQENKKLPKEAQISSQLITEAWEKVVKQIEEAFGKVPNEFNVLAREITGASASILNDFRRVSTEPLDILRTKAASMLKAFKSLYSLRESGVLDVSEDQIRTIWSGVSKAIEEAYGAFPDELLQRVKDLQELTSNGMLDPKLIGDAKQQFKDLGAELVTELNKLPPEAQKMWKKMVLIPELTKQDAINSWKDFIDRLEAGMTVDEWATYKLLKPMIKGWTRAFKDINNMQDVSNSDRLEALEDLLNEIEAAGGKYTDIWKRVYDAIKLLNKDQTKSFSEMIKDVTLEAQRELANALEDLFENWRGKSQRSLALVRMDLEDNKRALRDSLVEGKITHERYYAELTELDRQYNEEKKKYTKGFQKFYLTIWDSMKKYWMKLLADMLAQWIMTQLKMLAMSIKRAVTEQAADAASAKTKAVKSAAGIPFPLNIAAIGVAVAAVAAMIASVAKFAQGGIVTKPMLGMIGEAGPEAIIPLSHPMARDLNRNPTNAIFNDQFVFEGPTMVDDEENWGRIYQDKILPAKRRNLEQLRDISGERIE